MKNPSAIAKELRDKGHKFSQTRLLKDLQSFECVFQHGRYKFYNDETVELINSMYTKLYPIKVKEEEEPPTFSDLQHIRAMLHAICTELNIKTTTEIK